MIAKYLQFVWKVVKDEFSLFHAFNKQNHQQTSRQDRTRKTKNWERAEIYTGVNATVIKESHRRHPKTHLLRQMEVTPAKKREGNAAPQEEPVDEWGRNNKDGGKNPLFNRKYCIITLHRHEHAVLDQSRYMQGKTVSTTCPWVTLLWCWFTTITVCSWIWARQQGDSAWILHWLVRSCDIVMLRVVASHFKRKGTKKRVLVVRWVCSTYFTTIMCREHHYSNGFPCMYKYTEREMQFCSGPCFRNSNWNCNLIYFSLFFWHLF